MKHRWLGLLGASCALASAAGCEGTAPRVVATTAPIARAAPPAEIPPAGALVVPSFSRDVGPLIERYCLDCHEGAEAEAGVALDALGGDRPDSAHAAILRRIDVVLRFESMPPEGEPRPTTEERETLAAWLDSAMASPAGKRSSGHATIRRLNRAEYDRTIRDLVGLDLHPAREFPADDVGHGFDNNADVLTTPPILVEQQLAAAESVIAAVFHDPAARHRILEPAADFIPLAFRKYTPPVQALRDGKRLRGIAAPGDPELARQQRIYDVLRAFADRAFRRPSTHDELTRLLSIVLSAEKDGEVPEAALRLGLVAVLSAPPFVFRLEQVRETGSSADFDLASRLSYFLWGSMPDDELFRLAARGALRDREILRAQVRRMLADSRSESLAVDFAAQWLQTRRLAETMPDPSRFPEFDEPLRAAMIRETQLFFRSIVDEDRGLHEFLDADYTYVNGRLARHYGIPDFDGDEFRRVSLRGTPRRGLLTQAAVLTATSNPTRTSPVKRGKWILENILGTPPAPPPSGVEALKEGATPRSMRADLTLRRRLERHRSDPVCASCHRPMDPLGFALENFDAIGAWRATDEGRPIDASARLSGGRSFAGPDGLRAVLRSRQNAFGRCLAEKMLTYAIGRGLERADRREVDRITACLAVDDRFSSLILAIVESGLFLEPERAGGDP